MPELPEVETTVRDLKKKVLNRTFIDVWSDAKKIIKRPSPQEFVSGVKGKKIKKVWRRAKNIIFDLSGGLSLLIHLKMTGHLLYGKWQPTNGGWLVKEGFLQEKVNTYIHLIFFLDNGFMLALSDLRKFAKAELWGTEELKKSKYFRELGPEPLEKQFTLKKFKDIIQQKRGKIKQILMDQNAISGIGNIYSDEILWQAEVHPAKSAQKLDEKEIKKIYRFIKKTLKKAVFLRGTSISDFRDLSGAPGYYAKKRKVYRREGEKCFRCGEKIKRMKIGGRSSHFCPHCQKM